MAASIRCVSFTPVVMNAKLADWSRHTQTKTTMGNEKIRKCVCVCMYCLTW